jgi:hypothetical protein
VTIDGWLLWASFCSIYSLWNSRFGDWDGGYTQCELATSCAAGGREASVRYDVSFGRSPRSTPETCSYDYALASPCGNVPYAAISEESNPKMARIIPIKIK